MKQLFVLILVSGIISSLHAQNNTQTTLPLSNGETHDIPANVFILDTKNPSRLNVYNSYGSTAPKTVMSARKLVTKINQTTAFKISNINPLRFNYYLNGQLVTQFMDNTVTGNPVTDLLANVPVNDILTLDIFSVDKEVINQKVSVEVSKGELKVLQDKLLEAQKNLNIAVDSARMLGTDSSKHLTQYKNLQSQYAQRVREIDMAAKLITNKLSDLEVMLNKLAINNDNTSLVNSLRTSLEEIKGGVEVEKTASQIIKNIDNYEDMNDKIDKIPSLLKKLSDGHNSLPSLYAVYNNYTTKTDKDYDNRKNLIISLDNIKYPTNLLTDLEPFDPQYFTNLQLEIFRIREYLTDKKISSLSGLLTSIYLELGKLLQNSTVKYARRINELKNMSFIDEQSLDSVKEMKEDINRNFNLIQLVNAHTSVLIVFMQINDAQSKDLGTKIISLYKVLLNYLKLSDYICESTTSKYTLAMHPNGSNIDLIRYTVKEEDVLTKNSQTYVYDIWIKGGLKIDFSAGMFATGLMDREYEKMPYFEKDTISKLLFSIKEKNKGNFNFAFGGMVNITPRLGTSWIVPGISIGVAYANNQKLQFLAGGSLLLGKTERIILHAGAAMGLAQTLDNSRIVYDSIYVRGDMSNYNIPTVDKFTVKYHFGISYNLSKKNALQAVSGEGLTKFNSSLEASH
jgi:hypothetical protein